jgi:DNA repair protein RecN (Recombination protein N)
MLRQLHVKNYAIIDEVTIHFSEGLNIITGETGAGKSILLGALGLVLGERADLSSLFNQDKKCVIEAVFIGKDLNLKPFFDQHELDFHDEIIVRRELLPTLRSRAFINDTPVKAKILKELALQLINVHRQFATLDIFEREFQTKILDTLAGQNDQVALYRSAFKRYKKDIQELKTIKERLAHASRENDFIKFQVNEIEEISPNIEEDDNIQQAMTQAEHAEEIQSDLQELELLMESGEQNLTDLITSAMYKAGHLAKISSSFLPLQDRLASVKIEIEDIVSELSRIGDGQEMDPQELATLKTRYDQLQKLYFKHQVNDSAELIGLLADMKNKIQSSTDDEDRQAELEQLIIDQKQILSTLAENLSKARHKIKAELKKKTEKALHELAMSNATFSVNIKKSPELQLSGIDEVDYLFSANPGSSEQPLQQVASGGELSRLSLALKSIIAHELALPTMVFDEIDSGVSGDTALRMGRMLRGLGKSHQTIVITHSPQVAAQGDTHLYVRKEVNNGSTQTYIDQLNTKDRKEKIAIMLSSDPPTAAAKKNAQDLLSMSQ